MQESFEGRETPKEKLKYQAHPFYQDLLEHPLTCLSIRRQLIHLRSCHAQKAKKFFQHASEEQSI